MDTIHIFDTTLRDGEQSPGFSMNREEKLRLARQLEQLGVDVIEAGFPIASPGDLEAVRAVAAEIKHCRVAALARARQEDMDAALRAIEPAAKPRLHIFLATSDLHLKHKLAHRSREEALDASRQDGAIRLRAHAKKSNSPPKTPAAATSNISAKCSSRRRSRRENHQHSRHRRLLHARGIRRDFPHCRARTSPHIPNIDLSAHCHNDLGLAVANSLAAIAAGARQVECTINGIGERAGNASLEEIAVALQVRQSRFCAATTSASKKSIPPAACSPRSRAYRCRRTKPSSAQTPSRTKPASTRTAS